MASSETTANGKQSSYGCAMGIENKVRIEKLCESDVRQWEVLDKLRDRLPNWAVFVLGCLTALLSATLTLLITHI